MLSGYPVMDKLSIPFELHTSWSCVRHSGGPKIKLVTLYQLFHTRLSFAVVWSFRVHLVALFCFGISLVFSGLSFFLSGIQDGR